MYRINTTCNNSTNHFTLLSYFIICVVIQKNEQLTLKSNNQLPDNSCQAKRKNQTINNRIIQTIDWQYHRNHTPSPKIMALKFCNLHCRLRLNGESYCIGRSSIGHLPTFLISCLIVVVSYSKIQIIIHSTRLSCSICLQRILYICFVSL